MPITCRYVINYFVSLEIDIFQKQKKCKSLIMAVHHLSESDISQQASLRKHNCRKCPVTLARTHYQNVPDCFDQ